MTIVHAIAQLRFGAGRYVVDTALEQHRREPGSVAVVISEDAEPPWQSSGALIAELTGQGIRVHRCGDFFHRHTAVLKASANAFRDLGIVAAADVVVHAHTAMAAVVARWADAPTVIASCHGWGPGRPAEFDLQDALAFSACDRITTPSNYWADVLREKAAVTDVRLIPYGIDVERLAPLSARGQTDRPVRIVCVGELDDRKGQDVLLHAMAQVWDAHPTVELHFFGDGNSRQRLQGLARSLDDGGGRVVFHGTIDDPYPRLAEFDIFALASRSDNQPLAIIEAMLAGLPIVATRVGGITDLVEGARGGLIVPPDSAAHLATALDILIGNTVEGRRELGAAGERYARRTFDIRRHAVALDRLYRGKDDAAEHTTLRATARATPPTADGPLRLHLGCGPEHREGWINVDARAIVGPDVVARVDALPMFEDSSVDTIEACHLFEHLTLHEARNAVREWFRVLKPEGELLLELPNLDACVQMLGDHRDDHGYELGMVGIYGWPVDIERDGIAQMHKWGWTPASLTAALQEAGFTNVETMPITQTWRPASRIGRDFRVRAAKAAAVKAA